MAGENDDAELWDLERWCNSTHDFLFIHPRTYLREPITARNEEAQADILVLCHTLERLSDEMATFLGHEQITI